MALLSTEKKIYGVLVNRLSLKDEFKTPIEHESLKDCLKYLLKDSGLNKTAINEFLSGPKIMDNFTRIFTNKKVSHNNNENYEFFGDTAANKSVTNYMADKFSTIAMESKYVSIFSDLSQLLKEKLIFAAYGKALGFGPFYNTFTVSKETKSSDRRSRFEKEDMKSEYENMFEAFCGFLEISINEKYPDAGFGIVKNFMVTQMNKLNWPSFSNISHIPIILSNYIRDWNPVTALKEMEDFFKDSNGSLLFKLIYSDDKKSSSLKIEISGSLKDKYSSLKNYKTMEWEHVSEPEEVLTNEQKRKITALKALKYFESLGIKLYKRNLGIPNSF